MQSSPRHKSLLGNPPALFLTPLSLSSGLLPVPPTLPFLLLLSPFDSEPRQLSLDLASPPHNSHLIFTSWPLDSTSILLLVTIIRIWIMLSFVLRVTASFNYSLACSLPQVVPEIRGQNIPSLRECPWQPLYQLSLSLPQSEILFVIHSEKSVKRISPAKSPDQQRIITGVKQQFN